MRGKSIAILLAGAFALLGTVSAHAGSTGMENMHTLRFERGKLCMVGHYHYGVGSSQKSKKAALKEAQSKWADFVHLEYGSDWSRFSVAASRGVKCTKEMLGYHCSVSARPCTNKRARLRQARRKKK